MHTMNLKIDDSFFPHFQALIESFVKDKKVEIIENYNYDNNFPKNLTINNVHEVQNRVFEAETRIKNGEYITEEQYDRSMDKFFKEELGIER